MEQPLVSIITPSYNQFAFLEYTLRSVIQQDYKPVEYIVIDGASTDGSVDILHRYADRLAYWVSEPDKGQAEAIDKGFRRARGEIIAWLNSDDLYLPGAISSAVKALQANPKLGLVFGDAITIDTEGHPLNRLDFGDWSQQELLQFRIICQPAVFMRRAVLEQAGYLDPSFHYMLDHHLWIRMACLAPIQHIPRAASRPLAAARHHPHAKNVSQAPGFGQEAFRILDWMQSEPVFAEELSHSRRKIKGGAHRLRARYLLDDHQEAAALKEYLQALKYWPAYTLKHSHRMAYAAFCAAGMRRLASRLRRVFDHSDTHLPAELAEDSALINWPGLLLPPYD